MNTETPSTPWYVWAMLGLAAGYALYAMTDIETTQEREEDDDHESTT